jgi:hypothetical protein
MLRPIQAAIAILAALCGVTVTFSGPSMAAAPAAISSYCFDRALDDGRPRHTCIALNSYSDDVCTAIETDAEASDLPPGYFARLIWQESHFDAGAMSWAGAQGIAQFMPSTGRLQGLGNAYNPAEALWRSAQYLQVLREKFGNLGLAAAAYNGGENGVARFIAGTGYLAAETLDYVQIITGIPVTQWLVADVPTADYTLADDKPFHDACVALAETRTLKAFTPPTAIIQPWGIQMQQFFSEATARRFFSRIQADYPSVLGSEELMLVAKRNPNFGRALRWTVEIGRGSRAEAQTLCDALHKAGGACIVVRN